MEPNNLEQLEKSEQLEQDNVQAAETEQEQVQESEKPAETEQSSAPKKKPMFDFRGFKFSDMLKFGSVEDIITFFNTHKTLIFIFAALVVNFAGFLTVINVIRLIISPQTIRVMYYVNYAAFSFIPFVLFVAGAVFWLKHSLKKATICIAAATCLKVISMISNIMSLFDRGFQGYMNLSIAVFIPLVVAVAALIYVANELNKEVIPTINRLIGIAKRK